ncbi:MAG: tRNA guanosine(34) transglycosylase Tgt [Candidatus Omnitrophica bacterium]|nr:tRNA guanosine(34) transglycosylase Tgt [Candidatus Omnitrophota bacterium]
MPGFKIISKCQNTKARAGEILTPHGKIKTPCFMPVATYATVKTLSSEDIKEMGYQMLIANAYHLYLKPGTETIKKTGSLHRFMNWNGAIVTDSGGFQIFSLEGVKIQENGVIFKSMVDGSQHFFSPESSMEIQEKIGADIIMAFDYCPKNWNDYEEVQESVHKTTQWAKKCKDFHKQPEQVLWGIIQGGSYPELRKKSLEELESIGFAGYGIGGLSIGEPWEETVKTVDFLSSVIPGSKTKYFMGLGMPEQIIEMVNRGIDVFDCGMPTRIARTGTTLSWKGKFNVKNALYKNDFSPLDEDCSCFVCRNYSKAYLRHLFNAREFLGMRLNSYHNLYFLCRFMEKIQKNIEDGTFVEFKNTFLENYKKFSI